MPDGTFEKRTDIARLMDIYPNFCPRDLKNGLGEILVKKGEVERILSS